MVGPPVRWIAPSTPPPPIRDELAALTIASVASAVISAGPWNSTTFVPLTRRMLDALKAIPAAKLKHSFNVYRSALPLLAVACLPEIPAKRLLRWKCEKSYRPRQRPRLPKPNHHRPRSTLPRHFPP